MRTIGVDEINDIALGASLLGEVEEETHILDV